MRILALDIGDKRIGIALSDPLGITAQGLETYQRTQEPADVRYIAELARSHGAQRIVLGWPINMNGTVGPRCDAVSHFARLLAEQTDIELDIQDERMTTMSAERVLIEADVSRQKRKKVIDKMAAVIILQNYLDAAKYQTRRKLPWTKTESSC